MDIFEAGFHSLPRPIYLSISDSPLLLGCSRSEFQNKDWHFYQPLPPRQALMSTVCHPGTEQMPEPVLRSSDSQLMLVSTDPVESFVFCELNSCHMLS